ncbi:unnamed protein product [Allacma fusca]|uniref:Uncharacterized protein n=1 Tax=Allacma fusca TaxID=39272 RepID=A0A8J2JHI8_9HEXA|nr:unnamed protein product [Allacma fusca]
MTEVAGGIENAHESNPNGLNMMVRSIPETIPEEDHDFPSPPPPYSQQQMNTLTALNLQAKVEVEDDEGRGLQSGGDSTSNPMDLDPPQDPERDNSMDSFVEDDSYCGSPEPYPAPMAIIQQQDCKRGLRGPGSEQSDPEIEEDSDVEGKLIIDANDQGGQRSIESTKIRSSILIIDP